MIYSNNNGIIPMNEGLVDLIKKAFCKKIHRKDIRPIKKNTTAKSASKFTDEEWKIIYSTANDFFKKHWPNITKIIKDIINEYEIIECKKAFDFYPYDDVDPTWIINESNDYENEFKGKYPIILSNNITMADMWKAEPKARTEYEGPIVQGVWDLGDKICSAINNYGRENNIILYGYMDGDWDEYGICLATPCKYLLSQSNNENNQEVKNESTIFRYADLITE